MDSWLALATRQFKDQGIREWCVGDTVDTNRGVSSRKHRVIPLGKKKTVPCYIQTLYYKHRFSWHNPNLAQPSHCCDVVARFGEKAVSRIRESCVSDG